MEINILLRLIAGQSANQKKKRFYYKVSTLRRTI